MLCYCGSSKNFSECCGLFLSGTSVPQTAEQLMRSRYSAYVTKNISYLKNTLAPENQPGFDEASVREWAEQSKWLGLKVLRTELGTNSDQTGVVEFIATFLIEGRKFEHHEISQFRRENERWYFVDGEVR